MKSYLDKFSLKNKVAFVAGGAGLLGSETAKALSDAGARVVILDINREAGDKVVQKLKNKKAAFENFDVTDLDVADRAIEGLQKKYNRIDIFVNASYPRTSDWGKRVEDLSIDSWRKNVDMHLN
ncbi:MAG: SDR family NAD(P)-dependent oxidoreductase, partial [Candidatus Daviesbacteria bacterium]|nr:SDR family NAD(P)-dependent oxidoreductase [Candidatus Daviesbacteria bacterium]